MDQVKAFYQQHKMAFSEPLRLRVHRSLSWLDMAESAPNEDLRFIGLWVAFNAAYAREIEGALNHASDRSRFMDFLSMICRLDREQVIYKAVWQSFPQSIRTLLNNRYAFQPFWDFYNDLSNDDLWQERFEQAKKRVLSALASEDTQQVLQVVFERLYTVRNQLMHGGATYGSRVNRKQLADGCHILSVLVPAMLQIMMENAQQDWGKPFYPVVPE